MSCSNSRLMAAALIEEVGYLADIENKGKIERKLRSR
jgi:hypothetical protein